MKRPGAAGAATSPAITRKTLLGRIGAVLKPTEHGGWGLTLEPILLGMLVAPTWAGALLSLAVFIAFLARQPAKTVAIDRRRKLNNARTILSRRVAIASGADCRHVVRPRLVDGRRFDISAAAAAGAAVWTGLRLLRHDSPRPDASGRVERSGGDSVGRILARHAGRLVALAGAAALDRAGRACAACGALRAHTPATGPRTPGQHVGADDLASAGAGCGHSSVLGGSVAMDGRIWPWFCCWYAVSSCCCPSGQGSPSRPSVFPKWAWASSRSCWLQLDIGYSNSTGCRVGW